MDISGRSIDEFSDQVLFDFLIESPQLAANLGIDRVGSRPLSKDSMPDLSDAAAERRRAIVQKHTRSLGAFDTSRLKGEQAVTARVLDYVLNEGFYESISGTKGHGFIDNPYPLTHLDGPHCSLLNLLVQYHPVSDSLDADAYLSRLERAHLLFDNVSELLLSRARQGVFAPLESIRTAISELQQFRTPDPMDNLLISTFTKKLQSVMDGPQVRKYADAAAELLAEKVLPSVEALVLQAQDQLSNGQDMVGAWQLPDGDAWYAWRLRGHTTTTKTPDEVHQLGLEGIDALHAEIRRGFADLGIRGGSIASLYRQLSESTVATRPGDREEILEQSKRLVEDAAEQMRPFFDLWPGKGVRVESIADVLEASQHSTYIPATLDGRRDAVFLINLSHLQMMSPYELQTLCMHETYPGHHVQLTIAQELTELPLFRRAMIFAAYLEGWAKYSEWFPIAEGLIDEPQLILGRLRSELYSTANLALDTGLHSLRWTRDQAMDFLRTNTGASDEFARVIVNRSLVTPGQLCAYKTGMLAVMGLHDGFQVSQGSAFDRRKFHNSILKHGALPLDILRELAEASPE